MDVKEKLKELGIRIVYTYDIECHGFYLPENNTIYINDELMGIDRENTIWHELGHYINEHDSTILSSPAVSIQQQAEADRFWIRERVLEFLATYDCTPEYVDVFRFLKAYKIKNSYYDVAEKLFKECLHYEE